MRVIFVVLIFLSCCSQDAFGAANEKLSIVEAQNKIQNLARAINDWEVGTIEIVWINPSHLINMTVTPATLDKGYGRKLIIRNYFGGRLQKNVFAALKGTVVGSFDQRQSSDLRWGVKFLAVNDGRTISSLYFSSDGSIGFLDQTQVSFKKSPLFNWLNSDISKFFLQLEE